MKGVTEKYPYAKLTDKNLNLINENLKPILQSYKITFSSTLKLEKLPGSEHITVWGFTDAINAYSAFTRLRKKLESNRKDRVLHDADESFSTGNTIYWLKSAFLFRSNRSPDELSSIKSLFTGDEKKPTMLNWLPIEQFEKYSEIFYSGSFSLYPELVNCITAEYRWAEAGLIYACSLGDEIKASEAFEAVYKSQLKNNRIELQDGKAKRSHRNLQMKFFFYKKDKLTYSVYQIKSFVFGLRGKLSQNFAKAIINELIQVLPI